MCSLQLAWVTKAPNIKWFDSWRLQAKISKWKRSIAQTLTRLSILIKSSWFGFIVSDLSLHSPNNIRLDRRDGKAPFGCPIRPLKQFSIFDRLGRWQRTAFGLLRRVISFSSLLIIRKTVSPPEPTELNQSNRSQINRSHRRWKRYPQHNAQISAETTLLANCTEADDARSRAVTLYRPADPQSKH